MPVIRMHVRFLPLIPFAAAVLVIGGGDAKALTIRYSFTNPSDPGYTGGTIQVSSLTQTLATSPLDFTVETGTGTFNVRANFSSANGSRITYQSGAYLWDAENFDFGASNTTQWQDLLVRPYNPVSTSFGRFQWYSPAGIGDITVSSITFKSIPAPGPLPILGAAAAFGWSRRLRKRITASSDS
jgi:hypothetical protein